MDSWIPSILIPSLAITVSWADVSRTGGTCSWLAGCRALLRHPLGNRLSGAPCAGSAWRSRLAKQWMVVLCCTWRSCAIHHFPDHRLRGSVHAESNKVKTGKDACVAETVCTLTWTILVSVRFTGLRAAVPLHLCAQLETCRQAQNGLNRTGAGTECLGSVFASCSGISTASQEENDLGTLRSARHPNF